MRVVNPSLLSRQTTGKSLEESPLLPGEKQKMVKKIPLNKHLIEMFCRDIVQLPKHQPAKQIYQTGGSKN